MLIKCLQFDFELRLTYTYYASLILLLLTIFILLTTILQIFHYIYMSTNLDLT